jgi:hypothetical protein
LRAKAVFYGHAFDLSDVEACAPTEATQTPFAFSLSTKSRKTKIMEKLIRSTHMPTIIGFFDDIQGSKMKKYIINKL